MYTGLIAVIPLHCEIRRQCGGVAPADCCRTTCAITIVYITPDVGATKHGPMTKIPDKCACPLSTNYM